MKVRIQYGFSGGDEDCIVNVSKKMGTEMLQWYKEWDALLRQLAKLRQPVVKEVFDKYDRLKEQGRQYRVRTTGDLRLSNHYFKVSLP